MNLSFDYYHNLKEIEFYLCNPDGRQLFPLVGFDRKLALRFNDLSELTFSCYESTTASDGTVVPVAAYDYVQTRRLIFATNIGWFIITNVSEEDNGVVKYKNVTCHSLQAALRDRGFYCEEKVYYFYNPDDPLDSFYNPDDDASVPSVMGQLYQQLGIQQDLVQGLSDPTTPYSDWTITYINSSLTDKARNFKESTDYGYEWIVKDVEEAFEVVVLFDFYYKTIHVMNPSEVTSKANVIYSFSNFMKSVEIEEDAENIVTVMNCSGDNCDISGVNPTGTNYICDFSYYMDTEGKWMSSALKEKIHEWEVAVERVKSDYESKVLLLRNDYDSLNSTDSVLQEISRIYTDLTAAVARKSIALADGMEEKILGGIVWCETVNVGDMSMDEQSVVRNIALSSNHNITAYKDQPSYDPKTSYWTLSGEHFTGTLDECFNHIDSGNNQYLYFIDTTNRTSGTSYCVLQGTSRINTATCEAEYLCKGFKRYTSLKLANKWMQKYDSKKQELQNTKTRLEASISARKEELQAIASSVHIVNYFASTPSLLKELYCYWIEGDYTNEHISVGEDTTQAEALDLENELLDAGRLELSKVCQPKLQFSLTSVDCTKQYEFRNQMNALELGKIITVEKAEGVWYYPALLEIEYNLDNSDTFSLQFANALRLDDWGYTYGDLMSDASSTSRKVSANWQNILAYSKEKEEITPLIKEPLSSTLRAAFANMNNQEFIIDETGILGRKFVDATTKDSFFDEQVRIINNVILFTDDNWETARAAFGKIYYTDDKGSAVSAYGLIGDTIIGSLMMSEKLIIKNADSSIILDKAGITIKKGSDIVLSANTNGDLTVRGTVYATAGEIGGCTISDGKLKIPAANITGQLVIGQLPSGAIPTATSDLTNDSGFQTESGVVSIINGTVTADYIKALSITATSLEVKNGSHTYFKAGNGAVQIGGFNVDSNSLYSGSRFSNSTVFLCTGSTGDMTIAGHQGTGWVFKAGDKFGVNSSGELYCTSAHLTGAIEATSGTFHTGCVLGENLEIREWTTGLTALCTKGMTLPSSLANSPSESTAGIVIVSSSDSSTGAISLRSLTSRSHLSANAFEIYNSGSVTRKISLREGTLSSYSSGALTYSLDPYYSGGDHYVLCRGEWRIGATSTSGTWYYSLKANVATSAFGGGGTLKGAWTGTDSVGAGSDRNIKHSIEEVPEAYDVLFDHLRPTRFKYNDGTSDRYHTGFIAQDVKEATEVSGLTTKDFAAYYTFERQISETDYVTTAALRYGEFVSLNTWQIQKLKQRVAELEQMVSRLQNKE